MATHISKSLVEMQNGNSNKRVISTAQSHCAIAAVQCIVIGPVCLWLGVCVCVCVCGWMCGWVCYHENSKLCASILTKLGL